MDPNRVIYELIDILRLEESKKSVKYSSL